MDARGGELIDQILRPRGAQHLLEGPVVELRAVEQLDLLAVVGELPVVLRNDGAQLLDGLLPPDVDLLAVADELLVVDAEHLLVGMALQQAVALGQHGVVAYDGGQVGAVELRDEGVQVAAPLVCGIGDQGAVGRGDDDRGNQPDMVREPVILLAVALEHLSALARKGADDLFALPPVGGVGALDEEKVGIVADALSVGHLQRRLAHRQVVDRIHDVGLSGAIVADQPVDTRTERELLAGDVLEIQQRDFLQKHRTKLQKIRTRHCTL